jgi:hypothetical protein
MANFFGPTIPLPRIPRAAGFPVSPGHHSQALLTVIASGLHAECIGNGIVMHYQIVGDASDSEDGWDSCVPAAFSENGERKDTGRSSSWKS